MAVGIPRYRRLLTPIVLISGLVSSALLLTAPPGHADCPPGELQDPATRMCWTQVPADGAYGGVGAGPCEPGLGLCMGDIDDYAPRYSVLFIPPPASDRIDH